MGRVGLHIRLSPELHARVKDVAEDFDVSMNELINQVLGDFFFLDKMHVITVYERKLPEPHFEIILPESLHGLQERTRLVDGPGKGVSKMVREEDSTG